MSKDTYKVSNWPRYNQGLKQRGAISIWLHPSIVEHWYYRGCRRRGGKQLYSDQAIEVCLVVRQVYHLALRQTEGFVRSLFEQLHLPMAVPDYTVLCRRSSTLTIAVSQVRPETVSDLVVDSTGLKVYGAGEWIAKKQGLRQERTWRKLHVALDESDQQVRAVGLTTNSGGDAAAASALLPRTGGTIRSFKGDGAYDKHPLRQQLYACGIVQIIPPHRAAIVRADQGAYLQERNEDVRFIHRYGKVKWKWLTNYHQRSKGETFMSRYKTIIGEALRTRSLKKQQVEVALGCKILNTMLQLAKPTSQKIT